MYYISFVAFLSVTILALGIDGKESVPVLIWDSQQVQRSVPAVSALQVVSFASFQDKYLSSFQPNNVLLFLQDTLSVEDLSSYPDELKHVSKQMETSHSLYLPAVEDASSIMHNHGYKVTEVESGSSLGGLTLNKEEKNLVVVHLPSTITNPSRKNALLKTDEVIGNVISKIGKVAPFTVIFTGKKPSVERSVVPHFLSSRLLKQVNSTTSIGKLYQSDCVMLYLRDSIKVYKDKELAYDLPNSNIATTKTTGGCEQTTTILLKFINIKTTTGGSLAKVNVEFFFEKKPNGRSWSLTEVELTENLAEIKLRPKKPMYSVPMKKAYSCGQVERVYSNDTAMTNGVKYVLVLPSLQVEPFTLANQPSFDASWDCVGFFTIPIWMGIFTGIILLFILSFGLYMVSSVKTMDRFDDPKGRHFMMVPNASD